MSNIRDSIKHIRRDFNAGQFNKSSVPENPLKLLEEWLEAAVLQGISEANAFVLSTAINNQPDSRVVLLRGISENGLSFFTNYLSKKAEDIESNHRICMNFYWRELDRQIRIHAGIKKLPEAESDSYFASRPRESQIGAWASDQSKILSNYQELELKVNKYTEQFEGKVVPRPDHWGGFLAIPSYYEFWQGRKNRLHDRIIYHTLEENKWLIDRLSP